MRVFVKSHYVVARKGSNTTFICEVSSLDWQTSSWWWYFNNTLLPKDQSSVRNVKGRMITELHIHNVSEGDEGLYKCIILGDLLPVTSNITLIVDEKGTHLAFFICCCLFFKSLLFGVVGTIALNFQYTLTNDGCWPPNNYFKKKL